MKKRKNFPVLCLLTLLLTALLSVPVSATEGYSDVPPDSACYESVTYLAEQGITSGTGGNCYSPDDLITVRQWAVMLCRTYHPEALPTASYESLGDACVRQCYREGWVTESAVLSRDSRMCRAALLESAFAAADIPVYDYSLYPGGTTLSTYDNLLRLGKELGLCGPDSGAQELMTRGDAAQVLYQLLTNEYEVEAPPLAAAAFLCNKEEAGLNPYLVELQKIPAPILEMFEQKGWKYVIDFDFLWEFSQERGLSCIGVASYSTWEIYVSDPSATIHEFGHFLDWTLDFPVYHEMLYKAEGQSAADTVLRDYSATNSHEYFADAFAFWIQNRDHEEQMKQLKEAAPETYAYLAGLESSGWSAQGWWLDLPPLASCLRNHSLNPCTRPFGGGAYPNAKMEEGFL